MKIVVTCPFCNTIVPDSSDEQVICLQCKSDLSDIKLLKSKALELCIKANKVRIEGDSLEAVLLLKDALEIDNSLVEPQILLGILYQHLKMYDRAEAILNPLIKESRYCDLVSYLSQK